MSKLLDLAAQVEAATADRQREMLWQAWQALRGSTVVETSEDAARVAGDDGYWRFVKMLDAEAYESAAMTLVPEGWSFSIGEQRGWPKGKRMFTWLHDHNTPDGIAERHTEGRAATPALALTAACLKARAAGESNG